MVTNTIVNKIPLNHDPHPYYHHSELTSEKIHIYNNKLLGK